MSPALITACTGEVSPILIRVETSPPECSDSANDAVRGAGLFSAMMATDSAFAMSNFTVMGTMAPFSAMSGALIRILSVSTVSDVP